MRLRKIIDIQTGELADASGNVVISTTALGSCVAIALYDPATGAGGMAHVMLPGKCPAPGSPERFRYVEDALAELLRRLEQRTIPRERLIVSVAGGGNVLEDPEDTICHAVIRSVLEALQARGLVVTAGSLGGKTRRRMSLDLQKGCVLCGLENGPERRIWSMAGGRSR